MPKRKYEETDSKAIPILTREEILEKKKAYWRTYYYDGRVKKTPEQIERKKEYLRKYAENKRLEEKYGIKINTKKAKIDSNTIISNNTSNNNTSNTSNNITDNNIIDDVQIFVGFLLTVSNKN